jgi:hypothetical protein
VLDSRAVKILVIFAARFFCWSCVYRVSVSKDVPEEDAIVAANDAGYVFKPDLRLVDLYVQWIEKFDIRHSKNWAKLFHNSQEAA